MTFDESYAELETEFLIRVREEGSEYLPLVSPKCPVDFVLVGMEPSLGRWASSNPEKAPAKAQKMREQGLKNFVWSMEDFILHFCIRHYLCMSGETYYITDLAKGAMLTKEAEIDRTDRYKKWYPIFLKELELVAKSNAKIISIGKRVSKFFIMQGLHGHAGCIMHYSPQASRHVGVESRRQPDAYCKFSRITMDDVLQEAKLVLMETGMGEISENILERLENGSGLSESRKKLMFDYKVSFERIRNQHEEDWRS